MGKPILRKFGLADPQDGGRAAPGIFPSERLFHGRAIIDAQRHMQAGRRGVDPDLEGLLQDGAGEPVAGDFPLGVESSGGDGGGGQGQGGRGAEGLRTA
jgi:hypothetical protein